MMKFMPLLNLALGAAFVLPMVAQDPELEGGLEAALASSRASLETMETIRRGLSDGEVSAVERLLRSTEVPFLAGEQRDERLRQLRLDVNRLQTTLDQIDAGGEESVLVHTPEISLRSTPTGIELQRGGSAPSPTAGLDSSTRDLVRAALPRPEAGGSGTGQPAAGRTQKLEADANFSASRLREGRLLYKSGKHEQALQVLKALDADELGDGWEAKYWMARCLEKLGREEEAIRQYDEITKAGEQAGGFAQNAKQDYEFLVWKRDFFQRQPGKKGQQ